MSIWDADAELKVDDFVALKIDKNGYREGFIQYIGPLGDKPGTYFGISLSAGEGTHDGTFRGERKFQTFPFKGVFVLENKIDRKLLVDPVSQRHLDDIKNLPWAPAEPRKPSASPRGENSERVRTNMVTKRKAGPRDYGRGQLKSSGWRPPDWESGSGVKRTFSKRRGQDRSAIDRSRKRAGSQHKIIFGKPGGGNDMYADRGKHRTGPGVDYGTRVRQQRRADRAERDSRISRTPQGRKRSATDVDYRRARSANSTPRGNQRRVAGSRTPRGYGYDDDDEEVDYDWGAARFADIGSDSGQEIDDDDAKASAPSTPGGTKKKRKHKRGVSWGRNSSREFIRAPGELEHEIIQSGDEQTSPRPPYPDTDSRSSTMRSTDSDAYSTIANPAQSRSNTARAEDTLTMSSTGAVSYGTTAGSSSGGRDTSRSQLSISSSGNANYMGSGRTQTGASPRDDGMSRTTTTITRDQGVSHETRSTSRSSPAAPSTSTAASSSSSSRGGGRGRTQKPAAQTYKLKIDLSFQCDDQGTAHLKRRSGIQTAIAETFDIQESEVVTIVVNAAPEGFTLAFEVIIRSELGVGEYLSTFDAALDEREFQKLLKQYMMTDDEPYVYLFEASYERLEDNDSKPRAFEDAVARMR